MDANDKVNEARLKLKEKFGKAEKVGGMKRKHKAEHKAASGGDKRVKEIIKKLGAQPLPDISEINLFTNDNQVIQFKGAEVYGSFQNQTIIVSGQSETKHLKDCFADVVTQLSPQQLLGLKDLHTGKDSGDDKQAKPDLANFEDEAKKSS